MTYIKFLSLWVYCLGGLLYQHSFGAEWDVRLQHLLDTQEAKLGYRGYCVHLGDVHVWTGNPIYAFGYDYKAPSARKRRPSLKTMYRLWKLREELLAEEARA